MDPRPSVPPPAPAVAAPRPPPPPLLPEGVLRPGFLAWTALLPQLSLLLLNLRSWWLINGEVTRTQAHHALGVLLFELGLLLGTAGLALVLGRRGRPLAFPFQIGILAAHALYLWFATAWISSAVPASVTLWVLPVERVIFHQFALVMPAVFHAALLAACHPLPLTRGKDLVFALGLAIAVPLAWLAGMNLIQHLKLWRWGLLVPEWLALALVFLSVLVCVMALLRACAVAAAWIAPQGRRPWALLAALVALAAPLGGLWLNATVPFPADFQTPWIYALTVLNGLLLLPRPVSRARGGRALWLAQAFFLPFTLYFFLVFLPFLPLALAAILAAGSGFLVLAPVALFMLHGWAILDGFARQSASLGRRRALALSLAAAAILPAWFVGNALVDRASLNSALDYVYGPDYRADARFKGSPAAVRRALQRLAEFKDGVDMPFLSEAYEGIVFGGMVLPDDKMDRLHRVFFGEGIGARASARRHPSIFRAAAGRPTTRGELRPARPPPRDVRLEEAITRTTREGECERALVSLHMVNRSSETSEFAADLALPPGVLVSGYWLTVGHERVPGRIFEKKAALWVYQMIRDVTRRDPGLLCYEGPRTLRLHVFPFAAREARACDLEFLFPAGLGPTVRIGDREIPLSPSTPKVEGAVAAFSKEGGFLVVPPEALAHLPSLSRRPYLHFLVDRSSGAPALRVAIARARAIAARFPHAPDALVSVGNYEWLDLAEAPLPLDRLASLDLAAAERALPARGGFCPDRGLKRAILQFADRTSDPRAPNPWLLRHPIYVVVRNGASLPVEDGDAGPFADLVPEVDPAWISPRGAMLEPRPIGPRSAPRPLDAASPPKVVLFRVGARVASCAANASDSAVIHAPEASPDAPVEVFDPAAGAFRPLAPLTRLGPGTPYALGAGVLALERALALDPSCSATSLARLVQLSRRTGVLAPSTSYIVVENSALWKTLQLAEKKKLANQQALEFTETPEPSTWVALGAGLVLLALLGRRRERSRPLSSNAGS